MKKVFFGIIIVIIILVIGNKKEDAAESISVDTTGFSTIADGVYTITNTPIAWEGKRPLIQGYLDSGTLMITSGTFSVDSGIISEGVFSFDMRSIQAIQTGSGGGADRLAQHLQSADFFDSENFPTAQLVITGSVATSQFTHQVSGLLTIKEETHPVEFNAQLLSRDTQARIIATIPVDRTIWGIRYGSGKFFTDIGERMIDDIFTVSFDITAEKVIQSSEQEEGITTEVMSQENL